MKQNNPDPFGINYLYFGLFFTLLGITCTSSIFLKDDLAGSRLFFWFYALGQAALEISIFSFLGYFIYRFIGRLGFWLFIGGTFFLLLLHFCDFMMDRILDLSIWRALSIFILDENLENFYFLLDASGIPIWAWCVLAVLVLFIPILGMLLYKGTSWLTSKRPFRVKDEVFLQIFFCIPAALFLWDYSASKVIHPDAYTEFTKSLPWKRTFLQPKTIQLPLEGSLRATKNEDEIKAYLETIREKPGKKPNIYLFIVESLRSDFIQPEIAPHLSQFRDENISATTSLSAANSTHNAWFSIFHSEFPLYWQKLQQQNWKMGSPALALFKKMGYKIRVYSSAELHYYGMESLLFGKDHYQADSFQLFNHSPPKEAYISDKAALHAMQSDLKDPALQEGQFIIIFWDGTHFDYSWPKAEGSKFTPFANEFAYFKIFHSQTNIELIRNRYRNAVHYMDSLFGEFLQKAPEDAIIAFTGDHGEEFFDQGHLFHLSHLVNAQTCVPIYLRLGGKKELLPIATHIDIMPSLLDASLGISAPFLEGESLQRPKQWPFALIARFNASQSPYEFCLHNGIDKLTLQFENRKNIFDCHNLKIMRLSDGKLREDKVAVNEWVDTKFSHPIERLFPKKE